MIMIEFLVLRVDVWYLYDGHSAHHSVYQNGCVVGIDSMLYNVVSVSDKKKMFCIIPRERSYISD